MLIKKKQLKLIVKTLICEMPEPFGIKVRKYYYRTKFKGTSNNFYILPKVIIEFISNFQICGNSGINSFTWISAMGGITIGNNVINTFCEP